MQFTNVGTFTLNHSLDADVLEDFLGREEALAATRAKLSADSGRFKMHPNLADSEALFDRQKQDMISRLLRDGRKYGEHCGRLDRIVWDFSRPGSDAKRIGMEAEIRRECPRAPSLFFVSRRQGSS